MSDPDDDAGRAPDADAGARTDEPPSGDAPPASPADPPSERGVQAGGSDAEPTTADAAAGETGSSAGGGLASDVLENAPIGEPQELDSRVRYYWILGTASGAIGLAAAIGVGTYLWADEYLWVAGVAFAALLAFGVARAVLLYRSWHYVVRDDSLYLHRGVLTRVQTVVPYVRVQHIDTRRSATERALGLSSLVVYTAGSRGADVTIPGLTPDRADLLQTRLKRLAIESEDEDAV